MATARGNREVATPQKIMLNPKLFTNVILVPKSMNTGKEYLGAEDTGKLVYFRVIKLDKTVSSSSIQF